jgi:hypothetical protein
MKITGIGECNVPNTFELIVAASIVGLFAFLLYAIKSLDELRYRIDLSQQGENRFREISREKMNKLEARTVRIPRQRRLGSSIAESAYVANSIETFQKLQYFQQFINTNIFSQVNIELNELGWGSINNIGPYEALKYNIYCAGLQIGRIEIYFSNHQIAVELFQPEFLKPADVYSIIFTCGSAHYPPEPKEAGRLFQHEVGTSLINHLLEVRNRDFKSSIYGWEHSSTSLTVKFNGKLLGYDAYCKDVARNGKNPFEIELGEIKNRAQREGYIVLDHHDDTEL